MLVPVQLIFFTGLGARARILAAVVATAGGLGLATAIEPAVASAKPSVTATAAKASKPKAKKPAKKPVVSAPPFYTLRNAKGKCRAHYSKQAITITVHKHRRTIREHQTRCVYVGSTAANGATANFPSNLPTAAVTVTVIPKSDDMSYTIPADEALDVGGAGVLTGDGTSGVIALIVSGTSHGTVTLNHDGTFRYVPDPSYSGVDSFTYRVENSQNESSTATVTIRVTPVAMPVDPYSVPLNGTISVSAPGVLLGDLGSGLAAKLIAGTTGGALALHPDGSFSYAASPNYSGPDQFTFEAVDSSGQTTSPETVTIYVGAETPLVGPLQFTGAIGNTELQVGGTQGSGAEVYLSDLSALSGDSDPSGGTLSVTPGTITTAQSGTVTLAADGTFTYQPPTGFDGSSDSFDYQVDSTEGATAITSATIDFNSVHVWYVNSAAPAGGDGSSAAPFQSLASVTAPNSLISPGDVIFLFGGGPTYDGGLTLGGDETLDGQGVGLTVDSEPLLAPGASPVIANAGGTGISLVGGDTVTGVTVNGAQTGISAGSATGNVTVGPDVSVTNATGNGVSDHGSGSLTVTGSTIAASADDGIDVSGPGYVSVGDTQVTGSGDDGIAVSGGDGNPEEVSIQGNNVTGTSGSAIAVAYTGNTVGWIDGNTIGDATASSGAANGDGISVTGATLGSPQVVVEVLGNTVEQVAKGSGIDAQTAGTGSLSLTLGGNSVAIDPSSTQNGVTVAAGADGDAGQVCLNASENTGAAPGGSSWGFEAEQLAPASTFDIQGFTGSTDAAASAFLATAGGSSFTGGLGGANALQAGGNTTGFTAAPSACQNPADTPI